jgi:four helix bundle protein
LAAEKGSLEELVAWQRAMDLVDSVYKLSKHWPREEVFGLTNQIRRAVVSVPSNVAEGHGRKQDGDFGRFLSIADGSLMEVKTQLLIAVRQHFCPQAEADPTVVLIDEVARLINGLRKSIKGRRAAK